MKRQYANTPIRSNDYRLSDTSFSKIFVLFILSLKTPLKQSNTVFSNTKTPNLIIKGKGFT